MKELLHQTAISIAQKDRIELINMLNISLASTTDLYVQLKQAHWNIKGPNFIGMHKLLDEIAELIEEQVDIIAERVTALGGTALGTIEQTAQNSVLEKYPIDIFAAEQHIHHLVQNFAILGEQARNNITQSEKLNDLATNDIYVDLARVLDKHMWFLEAHVQK